MLLTATAAAADAEQPPLLLRLDRVLKLHVLPEEVVSELIKLVRLCAATVSIAAAVSVDGSGSAWLSAGHGPVAVADVVVEGAAAELLVAAHGVHVAAAAAAAEAVARLRLCRVSDGVPAALHTRLGCGQPPNFEPLQEAMMFVVFGGAVQAGYLRVMQCHGPLQ